MQMTRRGRPTRKSCGSVVTRCVCTMTDDRLRPDVKGAQNTQSEHCTTPELVAIVRSQLAALCLQELEEHLSTSTALVLVPSAEPSASQPESRPQPSGSGSDPTRRMEDYWVRAHRVFVYTSEAASGIDCGAAEAGACQQRETQPRNSARACSLHLTCCLRSFCIRRCQVQDL